MAPADRSKSSLRKDIVVLVIILAALAALVVPVFLQTYQTSVALKCRQQLGQVFAAVQSYVLGSGGYPPGSAGPGTDWRRAVTRFLDPDEVRPDGSSGVWTCPGGGGYVGNGQVLAPPGRPLGSFRLRVEVGLVADGSPSNQAAGSGNADSIEWRHRGGANILFLDGHVELVPRDRGARIRRHWNAPQ